MQSKYGHPPDPFEHERELLHISAKTLFEKQIMAALAANPVRKGDKRKAIQDIQKQFLSVDVSLIDVDTRISKRALAAMRLK